MPIYEDQISHKEMEKLASDGHTCGQCGSRLSVCWGGSFGINGYILRCGADISHNTITRHDKEYEEKIRQIKEARGMDTKALMKMDKTTMLARVGQAKFPKDLTPAEHQMMADVCISYGLDPVMQELMIYQGNPYPTINARYRKAQETNKFDGINTRPATAEERKARNCKEGDYLYCAEVWVKGCSHPFVGWGKVRAAETKGSEYLPIVKDPDRQAEKRAEAMALRKGFSMPVPFLSWEEFEELQAEKATVDKSTGTIVEGEFKVTTQNDLGTCPIHNIPLVPGKGNLPPYCPTRVDGTGRSTGKKVWCKGKPLAAEVTQQEPVGDLIPEEAEQTDQPEQEAPVANTVATRDPATIQTITDLFKACNQDWKMQPADVVKEAGYNSKEDISERPSEIYRRIKEFKGK